MSTDTGTGTAAGVRWEDVAGLGELWEGDVLDVEVTGDRVRVGIPQDGLHHYHRGQGTRTPGMRGRQP